MASDYTYNPEFADEGHREFLRTLAARGSYSDFPGEPDCRGPHRKREPGGPLSSVAKAVDTAIESLEQPRGPTAPIMPPGDFG